MAKVESRGAIARKHGKRLKAKIFAAKIQERNRVQIPIKNINRICKFLGLSNLDDFVLVFEIKSIRSSEGIEFLQ